MIRALELLAERVTARTGSAPAARRASQAGMRRGGADAQRRRGERDEVVEADRLVVGDVVERPGGRALGGVDAGAGDVLDADHVPPVVALADHREAARLAQPLDELLHEPAAGAVDVARPDDDVLQGGLPQEPLALLLRAPVLGLDRQLASPRRAARLAPRR